MAKGISVDRYVCTIHTTYTILGLWRSKDNGVPFLSLISRCKTVSRIIASLMLEMDEMREDKIRFKESVNCIPTTPLDESMQM